MISGKVPGFATVLSLFSLVPNIVTATARSNGCDLGKSELSFSSSPFEIGIGDRAARVTIPKSYKHGQAAPLIVAFHDAASRAEVFEEESGLSGHQNNTHHVVVYPRAVEGQWRATSDQVGHDLAFIRSLLDELNAKLCIDMNRVYATGLGTGAGLANHAACDQSLSTRFAAYAMVNGAFGSPRAADNVTTLDCTPARPATRILSIHGQLNTVHRYFPVSPGKDDAGELPATPGSTPVDPSIVQWLVDWALLNDCGASFGHPSPLSMEESPEDAHLTRLQRGSLTEAFVHNEGVIAASYKCWTRSEHEIGGLAEKLIRKYDTDIEPFGDIEAKPEDMERFVVQRIDEIVAGSTAALMKMVKAREEVAKEGGEERRQRIQRTVAFAEKGAEVLRHFAVQDAGHGWLRLEGSVSGRAEGHWSPLRSSSRADPATTFDSTAEVLQWFTMHRLSDALPTSEIEEENAEEFLSAINDEKGINEFLKEMSEQIVIKDQITKRLLGDLKKEMDPSSELGKQRVKERKEIREKYEKLQAQERKDKERTKAHDKDKDEL